MGLAAFFTGVDGCAVMVRATVDDGVNDFAVSTGHGKRNCINIYNKLDYSSLLWEPYDRR